ncbi:MAG: dTDP-4-dehydrorhamnose 3,5-epimerase family protein [Lacisediminihabitans sp.]
MEIRELSIPHAFVFTPLQRRDDRGVFFEWYRFEQLESRLGHSLRLRQANTSVSARGVARGIHYALVPPGQAKYVTVASGAVLDFVVDLRVGSPSFGAWESVLLDDVDRRAVYLAEGLGHAFISLTDGATVTYLVSEVFNNERELSVNALDPEIGLDFSSIAGESFFSPRDLKAPSLAEAAASGSLPLWEECLAHYDSLAEVI